MFNFLRKLFGLSYYLHVAQDIGPKNADKTIVFWHGIAADSSTWDLALTKIKNLKKLKQTRLICIDLLGFGKSPAPVKANYTNKLHLKSLNKTLRRLNVGKFVLVGHSMGALLAAEYVYEKPRVVSDLILLSPPFLMPDQTSRLRDQFYRRTFASIGKYSSSKALDPVAKMAEKFSHFRAEGFNTPAFRGSMDNVILSSRPMNSILNLPKKATIIAGIFDVLVIHANLEYIAKSNKNIKLKNVKTGHDVRGEMVDVLVGTLENVIECKR